MTSLSVILDTEAVTSHGFPSMCLNNLIEQANYEQYILSAKIDYES